MSKESNCYCAFCKTPRRVERRKHASILSIMLSALLSIALSVVFWAKLDIRCLVFFVTLVGVIEFFVHFRWRLNIVCQHCGFDPVLYSTNPAAACDRVKDYMAKTEGSVMGTVRRVTLPKRALSKKEIEERKSRLLGGKNLSKQV